jgi:hypothetical protein
VFSRSFGKAISCTRSLDEKLKKKYLLSDCCYNKTTMTGYILGYLPNTFSSRLWACNTFASVHSDLNHGNRMPLIKHSK